MHDFEVNDDISVAVEPAVITPDPNTYALKTSSPAAMNSAVGLRIGFRF